MSVLLVSPPVETGTQVIERLISQGDEVRVVAEGDETSEWRRLGAHVAVGTPDADLIERAGQSSRTVVVFGDPDPEVLEAARLARIDRVVVVTKGMHPDARVRLEDSGLSYVVLKARKRGGLKRVSATEIAEAVDAADDLNGDVKLELDLNETSSWKALRIER